MVDKVQKIREEVARIQLYTQSEVLKQVLDYIDEVQKETVSEDLDIAASQYITDPNNFVDWIGNHGETDDISYIIKAFKAGAQWQKQQMISKAVDGVCSLELGEFGAVRTKLDFHLNGLHCGDKVKLIIIKQE